jgi:hypothetical protein
MFIKKLKTPFCQEFNVYVNLYFKLRNFVISQFGIRILFWSFFIKIKTRLNAFLITNKTLK